MSVLNIPISTNAIACHNPCVDGAAKLKDQVGDTGSLTLRECVDRVGLAEAMWAVRVSNSEHDTQRSWNLICDAITALMNIDWTKHPTAIRLIATSKRPNAKTKAKMLLPLVYAACIDSGAKSESELAELFIKRMSDQV